MPLQAEGSALRIFTRLSAAFALTLTVCAASLPAHALPAEKLVSAPMVSPAAAWSYYGTATTHTNGVGAWSTYPPEIIALGRILGAPRLAPSAYINNVYAYINNNIEVEFRFGLGKGGRGALIEQSGTPFDQAELMFKLLGYYNSVASQQNQIAYSYQVGTIALSAQQFGLWTGLVHNLNTQSQSFTVDAGAACQFLADGAIPAVVNGSSNCSGLANSGDLPTSGTVVTLGHIWIVANGTIYDPAFKQHWLNASTPASLSGLMGCNADPTATSNCGQQMTAALMDTATTGTFAGSATIQGIDLATAASTFNGFSVNVQHGIQAANRFGRTIDIVGGKVISNSAQQPQAPTYAAALSGWAGDIPDQFRATMTVHAPGGGAWVGAAVFYGDEIAGRRIQFIGAYGITNGMLVDGVSVPPQSCSSCTAAATSSFEVDVQHPYATASYGYDSAIFNMVEPQGVSVGVPVTCNIQLPATGCETSTAGSFPVTLVHSFGDASTSAQQFMSNLQTAAPIVPPSQASMPCRPATVTAVVSRDCRDDLQPNVAESVGSYRTLMGRIVAGVTSTAITHHHSIGIVYASRAQGTSYTSMQDAISINGVGSDAAAAAARTRSFEIESITLPAVEAAAGAGVLDGPNMSAVDEMFTADSNGIASSTFINVTSSGGMQSLIGGLGTFSASSNINADPSNTQSWREAPLQAAADSGYSAILQVWGAPTSTTAYLNAGEIFYQPNSLAYAMWENVKGAPAAPDPELGAMKTAEVADASAFRRKDFAISPATGDLSFTAAPDLVTGAGSFPESLPFIRYFKPGSVSTVIAHNVVYHAGQSSSNTSTSSYSRNYTGADRDEYVHLGGGWEHNYDVSLTFSGSPAKALGEDFALEASSAIAAVAVLNDTLSNPTFQGRISAAAVTCLASSGYCDRGSSFNDGFYGRLALVKIGNKTISFVRLPDGSYIDSAGSSAQLVPDFVSSPADAKHVYTGVDGDQITFSWSFRSHYCSQACNPVPTPNYSDVYKADKWAFPNGVNVNFSYSLANITKSWSDYTSTCTVDSVCYISQGYMLTGVSNNLGRSLTFTLTADASPTGERLGSVIARVQDENGRSVTFSLTNADGSACSALLCDTFSVTDPKGLTTSYQYNAGADSPDPSLIMRPSYQLRRWFTPGNSSAPYLTVAYDGLYRVQTVTDLLGHQTQYYPGAIAGTELWKRADVLSPMSEVTTSIFDLHNSAISVTDPLGRTTRTAFDNASRKILETRPLGDCDVFAYDLRNNLLSTTKYPADQCQAQGAQPLVTTTSYGVGSDLSTAAAPSTVIACANLVTCNKATSETDARGNATTYQWDATTGELTALIKPADLNGNHPEVDLAYSSSSPCFSSAPVYTGTDGVALALLTCKTEVIAKSGSTNTQVLSTSYAYNSANKFVLQSGVVDAGGLKLTTNFTFDNIGNLQSVQDPNLNTTNYVFDTDRRLSFVIKPAAPATVNGATQNVRLATHYNYDADSELTETDAGYASQGLSTGSDFSALEKATFAYDAVGNKIQATAATAIGQSAPAALTEYSYDADDRLLCTAVRMSPPAYGTASSDGCTLVNAADRISKTIYDAAGQKVQESRALGTSREQVYATYAYTPNGKQASVMDAYWASNPQAQQKGNMTCYLYDGFDRLVATEFPVTTPGAGQCDPTNAELIGQLASGQSLANYQLGAVVGGYDADGNKLVLTKRDGTTTISWCYDALNRLVQKYLRTGNVAVSCASGPVSPNMSGSDVATTYDLNDKVLSAHYANGTGVNYGYDTAERLTSETSSTATSSLAMGYQLDANGNPTQVTWPGSDGFFVGYTYDALNRVANVCEKQSGSTCQSATTLAQGLLAKYAYDNFGRKVSLTRSNGTSTSWGWDPADRMASLNETIPNSANAYSWSFQYNAASQLTWRQLSNPSYIWQASSAANQSKAYDGLNRDGTIAAISDGYDKNGNLTDDGARHFAYDYENRLICEGASAAVCQSGGTVTAQLAYDPTGRLQQDNASGGGGANTLFLYRADKLSAEYDAANSNTLLRRFVHGPGTDEPLVWYEYGSGGSVTRNWLHVDRQGSVIAQTDDIGNVIKTYAYGPYGEPRAWGGSRFAYTGQIQLPELQLYHYKARVYDPASGRFLQTDPVGYAADNDLYAYVGEDPLDKADPTGLSPAAAIGLGAMMAEGAKDGAEGGCAITAEIGCVEGAAIGAVGGVAVGGAVWACVRWCGDIFHFTGPTISNGPTVSEARTGKNDPHINQERKERAAAAAAEAKKRYEALASKPNKTPADKKELEKARKEYEHQKKKAEATGENHGQRGKGVRQ